MCRPRNIWMRTNSPIPAVLLNLLKAFAKENLTSAFPSTQHHHQGSIGYFSRVSALEQRSFSTNPAVKRLDPQAQTWPGWDGTPEALHWDRTGTGLGEHLQVQRISLGANHSFIRYSIINQLDISFSSETNDLL